MSGDQTYDRLTLNKSLTFKSLISPTKEARLQYISDGNAPDGVLIINLPAPVAASVSLVDTMDNQDLENKRLVEPRIRGDDASSAVKLLVDPQNSSRTPLTFPSLNDGTEHIVCTKAVQNLTNKMINDASNYVVANELRTATGSVIVSSALAPTVGQVLRAVDANNAVWSDVHVPFYASAKHLSDTSTVVGINNTTTDAVYLTLQFNAPKDGNYDVDWSYVWSVNSRSQDFMSRVLVDGVLVNEHTQEAKDDGGTGIDLLNTAGATMNSSTNQRYNNSGFENVFLTEGSHSVVITWRSQVAGIVSTIYRGSLRVQEV